MSNQKLKLKIKTVVNPAFRNSFMALCNEPGIPVKEKYALGRTMNDIDSNMASYDVLRMKLVHEHGEPQVQVLKRRLARLVAQAPATGEDPNKAEREKLEKNISILDTTPNKAMEVDRDDPARWQAFQAKLSELQDVEFEIFLDHKVKLPEGIALTAVQLSDIVDLITVE